MTLKLKIPKKEYSPQPFISSYFILYPFILSEETKPTKNWANTSTKSQNGIETQKLNIKINTHTDIQYVLSVL